MQNITPAPTRSSSRLRLLLLLGIFAAPVIIAWTIFYLLPNFRPAGTMNHGDLIQPVRQVPVFNTETVDGKSLDESYFQTKWTMVYANQGSCDKACIDRLYVIRQVRLTQGKNIDRLQRLMVWDNAGVSEDEIGKMRENFPGMVVISPVAGGWQTLMELLTIDAVSPGDSGRIYLVDPMGNLMMSYDADEEPRGMIKDFHRLLKYSGAG
ncbi:MAG: hypothetical protein V3W04_14460 [Gammaproteobacteria bacterium]